MNNDTPAPATPPTPSLNGALLKINTVCDRLDCSRGYVYKLIDQKILDAVPFNGTKRVTAASVQRIIDHGIPDGFPPQLLPSNMTKASVRYGRKNGH